MPYIRKEDRKFARTHPSSPGELNYAITWLILNRYLIECDYEEYSEVVGVLECVKQEFYRRMCVPYENRKIAANGDVFPDA